MNSSFGYGECRPDVRVVADAFRAVCFVAGGSEVRATLMLGSGGGVKLFL